MWGATEVPDQAEKYANSLLLRAKFSEKETFNLLRATSIAVGNSNLKKHLKFFYKELSARCFMGINFSRTG